MPNVMVVCASLQRAFGRLEIQLGQVLAPRQIRNVVLHRTTIFEIDATMEMLMEVDVAVVAVAVVTVVAV